MHSLSVSWLLYSEEATVQGAHPAKVVLQVLRCNKFNSTCTEGWCASRHICSIFRNSSLLSRTSDAPPKG